VRIKAASSLTPFGFRSDVIKWPGLPGTPGTSGVASVQGAGSAAVFEPAGAPSTVAITFPFTGSLDELREQPAASKTPSQGTVVRTSGG